MVEMDNPISSSLALSTGEAAAIADDPHIPLPIPSSNDNEGDKLNIRPKIIELNIDVRISKTSKPIILVSIKYKALKSKVDPRRIIAIFNSFFSE